LFSFFHYQAIEQLLLLRERAARWQASSRAGRSSKLRRFRQTCDEFNYVLTRFLLFTPHRAARWQASSRAG
jgi:hypothetical protein